MIIRVLSAGGDEIASAREDAYVHLVLTDRAYEKGSTIRIEVEETPGYYMVKLDEALEETL